ncbi:MAG TPA: hypothetical protein VEN79_08510, partial [Terriglobia bacterium]|nr:hypothetical protein [Terriglobia bacterium]
VQETTSVQANHAVKQLLRLCLMSEDIAVQVLPELVQGGAAKGLLGEAVFARLLEARQRGEQLDVTSSEINVSEAERKLALEALFWPGDPPNLEVARALVRKLQLEKVRSGLDELTRQYNEAIAASDWDRAREIDRTKRRLQFDKVKAEIEKLVLDYNEAIRAGDSGKARELDRLKSNLDKELQRLGRA